MTKDDDEMMLSADPAERAPGYRTPRDSSAFRALEAERNDLRAERDALKDRVIEALESEVRKLKADCETLKAKLASFAWIGENIERFREEREARRELAVEDQAEESNPRTRSGDA